MLSEICQAWLIASGVEEAFLSTSLELGLEDTLGAS
jgi:hypothetical protein